METSVNNKCKAFASLGQSRKLAEFLPIESADMCYRIVAYNPDDTHVYQPYCFVKTLESDIPCWSLAALLDIIPQEIFDGEYIINITEGCDDRWVLTYDHYENSNHSYYGLSSGADNLVDVCYKIILKLHKQKLL